MPRPGWKREGRLIYCQPCWNRKLAQNKLLDQHNQLHQKKKRIKPLAKRPETALEEKEYSKLRKEFLLQPGNDVCNGGFEGCSGGQRDQLTVHHKRGRGKYYLVTSTWVTLCLNCHEYVHNHPKEAQALGLMESRLANYAEESV